MKTDDDRRRWDEYDAYLFDIDGTLLNCTDATHYFAFCSVLSSLAERPMNLDGVVAHGNTDIGIVRDALALAGIADDAWRPRLPQIRTRMCQFVKEHESELCIGPTPGVVEVLQYLRNKRAVLGVATGNLEQIGRLKLELGGLLQYFDFEAYSDEFESRADVIRYALRGIRRICMPNGALCIVGDTPADIRAAHLNGVDVIAVATGNYSIDELEAAGPEICVTSLQQLLRLPESVSGIDRR